MMVKCIHGCLDSNPLDSSCLADAPPLCVESRRRLRLFLCVHREREGDGGGEGRERSDRNAARKEAVTAHAAEDELDGGSGGGCGGRGGEERRFWSVATTGCGCGSDHRSLSESTGQFFMAGGLCNRRLRPGFNAFVYRCTKFSLVWIWFELFVAYFLDIQEERLALSGFKIDLDCMITVTLVYDEYNFIFRQINLSTIQKSFPVKSIVWCGHCTHDCFC